MRPPAALGRENEGVEWDAVGSEPSYETSCCGWGVQVCISFLFPHSIDLWYYIVISMNEQRDIEIKADELKERKIQLW